MKNSALFVAALASGLVLAVLPVATFAGTTPRIVPEPSAIFIWAGIAGIGGAIYWWRNRSKS
jgi:LPXTG-motif cell wall-anchored protein